MADQYRFDIYTFRIGNTCLSFKAKKTICVLIENTRSYLYNDREYDLF